MLLCLLQPKAILGSLTRIPFIVIFPSSPHDVSYNPRTNHQSESTPRHFQVAHLSFEDFKVALRIATLRAKNDIEKESDWYQTCIFFWVGLLKTHVSWPVKPIRRSFAWPKLDCLPFFLPWKFSSLQPSGSFRRKVGLRGTWDRQLGFDLGWVKVPGSESRIGVPWLSRLDEEGRGVRNHLANCVGPMY